MYFLWKMGIFQPANLSLPEGIWNAWLPTWEETSRGFQASLRLVENGVGILFFFRRNSWRSSNCTWRGSEIGFEILATWRVGGLLGKLLGKLIQKISNRTTESTPKAEYLITRLQLTNRGPLGFGPILDLSYPVSPWGSHSGRQGSSHFPILKKLFGTPESSKSQGR